MADEPKRALIEASMVPYASSHTHMDETQHLIEQSRLAVMESRALLARTRPFSFTDLVTR